MARGDAQSVGLCGGFSTAKRLECKHLSRQAYDPAV